jgi:hypothetical protein
MRESLHFVAGGAFLKIKNPRILLQWLSYIFITLLHL